jgi:uncharacterized membrane protein
MLEATLLAFGSAALHAFWNLLLKTSGDRFVNAWGQFIVGAVLAVPILAVTGLPHGDTIPYLVASTVVHVVYIAALVQAYHHGDFSLAYPLARGGGALLAAIGGVLFLSDTLSAGAWLGIAIVVGGLASLARPSAGRAALLWAGITAATIGVYTTIDAAGARHTSSGVAYGAALFITTGLGLSVAGVAIGRGRDLVALSRTRERTRILVGGVAAVAAYSMVLAAVRLAPVGYVAALRESSVVLAALAGWLLLHERLGRARLISSAVVAIGLVLLVLTR